MNRKDLWVMRSCGYFLLMMAISYSIKLINSGGYVDGLWFLTVVVGSVMAGAQRKDLTTE